MTEKTNSPPSVITNRQRLSSREVGKLTSRAPIFILVEPQLGENVGAAARAILNFGITGMRLVAPRDGWPNPAAKAMAAGAGSVIDQVRVFDTLGEAVADCSMVLATTARPREVRLPVYSPNAAVAQLAERQATQTDTKSHVAVLFGGERAGLTSEHLRHADGIITVPVNPAFASLNLAQAVLLIAYEWGQRADLPRFASPLDTEPPAPRAEFDRLMDHLMGELEEAGFFHPPQKRPVMERNLIAAFQRAGLTHLEVQTLRGVVKALAKGRGKRSP